MATTHLEQPQPTSVALSPASLREANVGMEAATQRHGATLPAATRDDHEASEIAAEAAKLETWWATPRFRDVERPYTALQVAAMRPTISVTYPAALMADKLYKLLATNYRDGTAAHTFGALDPVQVVQMAKHLPCVYVSGWQCSSTASTTNEPGPDFADYPMNTVPNKVDQLFRAQLFHDRKQREARSRLSASERAATPAVDYLRPIIADGDTGHGGLPAVMRLTKLMIEAGAGGMHLEDQKPGAKKCGHMGGKVLVSTREHVDRLCAARLQADMMGVGLVLVARTDADSARLIDSTIDPRDHPFILGCANPGLAPLDEVLARAAMEGASPAKLHAISDEWMEAACLMRYSDCVAAAINASPTLSAQQRSATLEVWRRECVTLSNADARTLAARLGFGGVHWDWDAPRTREGYYRVGGGTDFCVARARAFAAHADSIWMETSTPNLAQAQAFARAVHSTHPRLMLSYNLSPSFNWDAAGMTDAEIAEFPKQLGRLGFSWQFITLAGFHSNALVVSRLSRALAGPDNVLAYVRDIQRKERDEEVETLMHQKWSGAQLADRQVALATGGVNNVASGSKESTEHQFVRSRL